MTKFAISGTLQNFTRFQGLRRLNSRNHNDEIAPERESLIDSTVVIRLAECALFFSNFAFRLYHDHVRIKSFETARTLRIQIAIDIVIDLRRCRALIGAAILIMMFKSSFNSQEFNEVRSSSCQFVFLVRLVEILWVLL